VYSASFAGGRERERAHTRYVCDIPGAEAARYLQGGRSASLPSMHMSMPSAPSSSEILREFELNPELQRMAARRVEASSVQLGDRIGMGHFGEVWEAVYQGKKIVVKTFKHGEDEAEVREALNVCRLPSHENIVPFVGYYRTSQAFCIMFERAIGSLDTLIYSPLVDKSLLLSDACLRQIAHETLSALAVMHDHKLVHRDLASRNYLVAPNGRIWLGDFGQAIRLYSTPRQQESGLLLKPPEGTTSTNASDMWYWAVSMLEIRQRLRPVPGMDFLTKMDRQLYSSDVSGVIIAALNPIPSARPTAKQALGQIQHRPGDLPLGAVVRVPEPGGVRVHPAKPASQLKQGKALEDMTDEELSAWVSLLGAGYADAARNCRDEGVTGGMLVLALDQGDGAFFKILSDLGITRPVRQLKVKTELQKLPRRV